MKLSKEQQDKLYDLKIKNLNQLCEELLFLRARNYLLEKRHKQDERYIRDLREQFRKQREDYLSSMNAIEALDEIVLREFNLMKEKLFRGRKRRKEVRYKLEQIINEAPTRRKRCLQD